MQAGSNPTPNAEFMRNGFRNKIRSFDHSNSLLAATYLTQRSTQDLFHMRVLNGFYSALNSVLNYLFTRNHVSRLSELHCDVS